MTGLCLISSIVIGQTQTLTNGLKIVSAASVLRVSLESRRFSISNQTVSHTASPSHHMKIRYNKTDFYLLKVITSDRKKDVTYGSSM